MSRSAIAGQLLRAALDATGKAGGGVMTASEARELTRSYPAEVVAQILDQAGPLSPDTLTLLRGTGFAEVITHGRAGGS